MYTMGYTPLLYTLRGTLVGIVPFYTLRGTLVGIVHILHTLRGTLVGNIHLLSHPRDTLVGIYPLSHPERHPGGYTTPYTL